VNMKELPTIKRIGLLGPYGFGNLGDAAIQEAVIHHIKKYFPTADIFGFSLNPNDTEHRHGIKSFPIVRTSTTGSESERPESGNGGIYKKVKTALKRIPGVNRWIPGVNRLLRHYWTVAAEGLFLSRSYKILGGIDLLIMSGGGQLDDFWGGPWGHPYTLLKWALMAKATKTKVIFMSVGADTIDSSLSRFFIKHSLLLAGYRSYRDDETKKLVESMGVREGNGVYPDLAYSLPLRRDNGSPILGNEPAGIVGISPIAACAWTTSDSPIYKNYLDLLVYMAAWLLERGYRVLFFPTQTNMDTPVINDIIRRLGDRGWSGLDGKIIENRILTVDDLISQISMVEMVIASRLHSVLLSHMLHKPVLAISYNRKVNVLMADMGLSDYCIDLSQLDMDSVIEGFKSLESNKDDVVKQIASKVSCYKRALAEQYDHVFGH